MKSWSARFNTYLLGLLLAAGAGCVTTDSDQPKKDDKSKAEDKKNQGSTVMLFLEAPSLTDKSKTVPVYRESPVSVTIEKEPFLDEGFLAAASVEEGMGGFYIKLKFGRHGTWVLENMSASHVGRRVGVFSQFPVDRWLAAPVLTHRLSDGVFAFTPDASREEADRIVRGLNNLIAKLKKKDVF